MFPTHLESTSPGGGEPFLLVVSWLVVMILFSYLPKCTPTHHHPPSREAEKGELGRLHFRFAFGLSSSPS